MTQKPYPLFQEFVDYIKENGISLANLFVIQFKPISFSNQINANNSKLSERVLTPFGGNADNLMMMATECSFPGTTTPTGSYRINNTPSLKYALGTSYNDLTVTFYLDSNFTAKKIFDRWENLIYTYNTQSNNRSNSMAVGYKDDYSCDISIIKYERIVTKPTYLTPPIPLTNNRVVNVPRPGVRINSQQRSYIMLLRRAFPISVSAVNVSNSASNLSTVSVTFDFESKSTSAVSVQGTGSFDFVNLSDLGYTPTQSQEIQI